LACFRYTHWIGLDWITSDLKPSRQCAQASQKAMSVLGMIKRNFRRITVHDFKILYNSYVRPHLEYCIQAWYPYLVSDISSLEQVQRRATKLVQGLKNRPYQERLKILGLYSLEQRRLRGDLIEMYKILTGKENIDYTQFFTLAPPHHNTRGHSLRLYVSTLQKYCQTQTEVFQSEGGQRLEWSSSVSRGCFIRQLVQESA